MDNLDKSCFAYQDGKRYPIHTKEDTLNSFRQYCGEKSRFTEGINNAIKKQFEKAARYHEIKLQEPEQKKEASTKHIATFQAGANGTISMPMIETGEELDKAVAFVLEKRASMSREELKDTAKYVMWEAANSDLDTDSPEIRKVAMIAGVGVCDRDDVMQQLGIRAKMASLSPSCGQTFWQFYNDQKGLSDEEFLEEDHMDKLCAFMDDIDRTFELNHKYGQAYDGTQLKTPEEACFGQTLDDLLKEASDMMEITSIDTVLSKKALLERKNAVNAFFQTHFGVEEPLSDQEMIEKVAALDESVAKAFLESVE